MGDRLCPSEEALSEYLSGCLPPGKNEDTEKHLVSCRECRKLLFEAGDVVRSEEARSGIATISRWLMSRKYPVGAVVSIALSFVIHRFFVQFLAIRICVRNEVPGRNISSEKKLKTPNSKL